MQYADVIDYNIFGDDAQYVEIELDPQESIIAEAGSMLFMESDIVMSTIFGDGSDKEKNKGIVSNLVGSGKRLLSGEGLFMTAYTNNGNSKQKVAFTAPYLGKILPIDLKIQHGEFICQADAFLCAARGVSISIFFNKNIKAGLFGGEGFILQKLQGDGIAFVHAGGNIFHKTLEDGETLIVDNGSIVGFHSTITYDMQYVGSVRSAVLGGEGVYVSKITGPGTVWLQSTPFANLANKIVKTATGEDGDSQLTRIARILNG